MRTPPLVPLLVSCDRPDAVEAALRSGADMLVLDLGHALSPGDRAARRGLAAAVLARVAAQAGAPRLVLRVAPLPSGLTDADLDGTMAGAPDAVLLPGVVGRADIQHLAAKLAVREAEHGLPPGRTGILALPADTARGVLALPTLPGASHRLRAFCWDGAALVADLGIEDEQASPCRQARALLLIAAGAGGVPAIDAGTPGDGEALARACAVARRDGFAGRLALGPDQVPVIAEGFVPYGA